MQNATKTITSSMPVARVSCLGLMLLGPLFAIADIVRQDDFQSYVAGNNMTAGSSGDGYTFQVVSNNPTNGITTPVVSDTGNLFGHGADNNYLTLADTKTYYDSGNPRHYRLGSADYNMGKTGSVTLNFHEPANSTATPAQGDQGWALYFGCYNTEIASAAFGIHLQQGTLYATTGTGLERGTAIGSYSMDTTHSLALVFNKSGAVVDDNGNTLSTGKMDVWLDGRLITSVAGTGAQAATGTDISRFSIGVTSEYADTDKNFMGTLYIDDLVLHNSVAVIAAVPEPAAVALILGALAVAGVWTARKRRV